MSNAKYETMRHIETVRNYLNGVIRLFMERAERHDQSKLEYPEVTIFEEYTPKLKTCTYGSEEYHQNLREMNVAVEHHYLMNRHHPEHFKNGIESMNMFDLIEMLVDWKSASLRHTDGDIWDSIEKNQKRFGYSDEMKLLLRRTMSYIEIKNTVIHNGSRS